ncbi:bifunctional tRNA (5-methylaminomethyl-2-thiouridine)(34)-methyltransferase MnmD/FAD-dependent 5-carboxymethylaminomethyl-2-thiouridine(34) oxidoreductase MnmC [Campylobacter hepaticus]|uniref:bifunctional tRNA (5-methylaminomethyl-2-thiouridine)(34)-methyltransferase MnmD/FAD-dependent 5-carboxymethylaminomethyl-2-thiouridine(34) oxidoreductase MnmC n=1 Tax=Campylobacter hepaticus TaxID=1813019 RepID=UPI0029BED94A|nr:bifunctional tRNA (5-methylaminomethyl-2-thiouridine)(34)-methyltransferase MnmD/FAD-dependent 5-carboxymethylaminomethyl-2-thiouridine(34) oxidoreductase MnmC [Campylobacter hepaticus]MDX2322689.1 bifunctional tRNA (5-methylaminomethyl-2-thiouridine)(34)-methyltransferase MnmD/FAD-dependent 5-carboxymethylaminomethyl-2-thiouridine(34) oxidoreductase MnmC [Campylobacter hepaticus]MDX2332121.1 bifunctional tRNA (5-methylaminomethyl-2-thiouridine)(34)-methyltransferase MnmD/FAD-dependent 5-carbo
MKKAHIIFKDNTPFSLDFDDFYFNSKDGLNESKYVYTHAFEWKFQENFVIAESGFGIGLNFFLTLKRFLEDKTKTPRKLFYISIEAFYIEKDKLREIYQKLGIYEEFKEFLEVFLKFYPKTKKGIYRFYFQNCFLDLIFDDISILKELDFKADIWYLDGFSPRKNPQMFDENLVLEVARLSKKGTQICTFSSASFLQKNLEKYGFVLEKLKGFKKREMIRAFLEKELEVKDKQAYFSRTFCVLKTKKIAIIGAGIASAILAYELSLRGFEVDVFEKNLDFGGGASGNKSGILSSLILKPGVVLGELSELSFIEASRFYKQILDLKFNGVMEFAYNDLMQERFHTQKENILFDIKDNCAFLEDGGDFSPHVVVRSLFEKSKAKIHFGYEFKSYEFKNELFALEFKDQVKKNDYAVLVYAMGADTKDFIFYEQMKLSKVRGQVTHLKPFLYTQFALSSKAYICPIKDGLQVIGASYDRLDFNVNPKSEDDKKNIENISDFISKDLHLKIMGSKVGFRSYSSDRFMIIGQAYDEMFYKQEYKALLWTKDKAQKIPKNSHNLYFNFAHGSRGFSTSVLSARYLCALINNEPLFLQKKYIHAIHPARFLIRKLKKGL